MTNRKLDQMISDWLEAEAPKQVSDRVLRATFERTRKARRQVGWRLLPRRLSMPRFVPALAGAAIVLVVGVVALGVYSNRPGIGVKPSPTPSSSLSPSPLPAEAEVTDIVSDFLAARVAGEGAGQYLAVPENEVPLLYATTLGAPYERAEFEQVRGIAWPRVWVAGRDRLADRTAFKVRLFAGGTVVEQLFFFTPEVRPLGLGYLPDGFGTHIAPTIEDGQPVARLFSTLDDEVTLEVAHPWVGWIYGEAPYGYQQTAIRLIPGGPGVGPTIDGAQRGDWDYLDLMADPAWVRTDCQAGPIPADAEALAESIRSDLGLEATDPAAVRVGSAEARMMDVKIAAGATLCVPATAGGDLLDVGLLHLVFDVDTYVSPEGATAEWPRLATGVATGEWMRLYLFDVPQGLSMRILAIAIVAPESRFEGTVESAEPIVDTIEFRGP
jgi:hypothetical protein